jgi:transcriptional regulator with XRE-family HTH domain
MADLKHRPVPHDHEAFLKRALKRKGFPQAYADLGKEYALARELLRARSRAGLTQEAVAERMGTTKTAVSRLEAAGRHSPSVTTLKKYAQAVGCEVEIRLVPAPRPIRASSRRRASAQRSSSP